MKKKSGFTLIEMMIVIAIIAILTAISIPNVIAWIDDHQLNSSTRTVMATIQTLRLRSIKESSQSWIWFDTTNNKYQTWVRIRGGAGNWEIENHELPAGIDLAANFGLGWGTWLSFNNRGLPFAPGLVTFTNDKGTIRRIQVPITGNARISG